jgi:DNA-directed RNA polymerase specialized sigma24 family protein
MFNVKLLLHDQIPRLMRYAAALTRDPDQALDLVEDTVLEALSTQQQWRRDTLRVELLTLLHDHRRNPFRQIEPLADPPLSELDPTAHLTLSDFDRALGRLPEEQRAVTLLVGLEGLRYNEAAAVLRVSVGTIRSRLALGRQNLRRVLNAANDSQLARAA